MQLTINSKPNINLSHLVVIEQLGESIFQVTSKVFSEILPALKYDLENFHKRLDFRALRISLLTVSSLQSALNPKKSIEELAFSIISLGTLLKFLGITYPSFYYEAALNSAQISFSAIGGYRAIKKGSSNLLDAFDSKPFSETKKTINVVSGILLTFIGLSVLSSVFQTASNLKANMTAFQELESIQQEGILKHGAFHTLVEKKTCNAVVIDGLSSQWGKEIMDNVPIPFNELLYRHCDTRYYRVNSAIDFSSALVNASQSFPSKKIDVLSINGHANHVFMRLGPDYDFFPTDLGEERLFYSFKDSLSSSAQIFLNGCNTGTEINWASSSFAQQISRRLWEVEVNGFAAFLNPLAATVSYDKNRFTHKNYIPIKEEEGNSWSFTKLGNAVRYVNGHLE